LNIAGFFETITELIFEALYHPSAAAACELKPES
jgi:hypothetical protein